MKHLYLLLFCACASAQIVTIPDAAFKTILTTTNCARFNFEEPFTDVDLNNDGEIQVSEAQGVLYLKLPYAAVNSIEGVQAFENLYSFDAGLTASSPANITLIENMSSLRQLMLGYMTLSAFDFSQLTELTYFHAGYENQLVVIDLSPTKVQNFNIDFCDSLEYLNSKNGYVNNCEYGPDDGCWNWQPLQSHFKHVCRDDFDFYSNNYTPLPWGVINSYCSFAPAGNYNVVTGNVTFDCGGAALPADFIAMNVTEGTTLKAIYSDHLGNYLYYMGTGNLTITPEFQNPYYTITPPAIIQDFTGTDQALDIDFCISPNGVHNDVEMSITPIVAARPGFDAKYIIELYNKGTQPASGNIAFNFNDDLLDYVSSTPAGNVQTGTVNWSFASIPPLTRNSFVVWLNVNSPTETPPVNINDVLNFTTMATTDLSDETPQNNTAILNQTVIGSFDPNDKLVAEGSQIAIADINQYLHYTVRFQNTGTAEAINVVIDDTLHSTLNPETVEILSSSHPMHATRNGNKLQFFHEGINLPASSIDEPGSHGYVSFKVKPAATVSLGSVIQNSARIFFDYNFPIVTNTAATTVVQQLGIADLNLNNVQLFPNPASESFAISGAREVTSVQIHNLLGQLIDTISVTGPNAQIPVSHLQSGTYLISIVTANGTVVRKLLKS